MTKRRGITLYLHVHQPWRIRKYSIFDTAVSHEYFNEHDASSNRNNHEVFQKIVGKSYRPMNTLLEKLLEKHPEFKLSLSITGTFIEQAERWAPDVLESFKRLVATGRVEIVSETYSHSLAFFYSRSEFEAQVELHRKKIKDLFGVEPSVFRNTELAYNDELAKWASEAGYKGILAEGWDQNLGWRSPNFVYRPAGIANMGLLLRNYRLSDDIAFRFSNRDWKEWPLSAEKYHDWVNTSLEDGSLVNLFMDYETFGEHHWHDSGIFDFFEKFVDAWLSKPENTFYTVSEAIDSSEPVGEVSFPATVSWADSERDLSAWMSNSLQHESLKYLYALEEDVLHSGDQSLIDDWRRIQASDHMYYMCTKWSSDGEVHAYFSPYDSPYDAFLNYMNVLRDIRFRLMAYHQYGGMHV